MQVIRNTSNGTNRNTKHVINQALFYIFCILIIVAVLYRYLTWRPKPDDFLIFCLSYTIGTCLTWKDSQNSCPLEHNRYSWTIHGIWPSRIGDDHPAYCIKDESHKFNEEDILPMRIELEERWPSVTGNNVKFWKHEWDKHGTCGMNLPQLDSEPKYFQQALDWYREFPVEKFLADASIYPNDMKGYRPSDIRAALKSKLKVNANVACRYDKRRKVYILVEIRICFNLRLSLTDCDDTDEDNCPEEVIYYPSTVNFRRSNL